MERRDWSLKALDELIYIDSLDSFERAEALVKWHEKYLKENDITSFDLKLEDLKRLQELFYKNVEFLKKHKEEVRQEMVSNRKKQRFFNH